MYCHIHNHKQVIKYNKIYLRCTTHKYTVSVHSVQYKYPVEYNITIIISKQVTLGYFQLFSLWMATPIGFPNTAPGKTLTWAQYFQLAWISHGYIISATSFTPFLEPQRATSVAASPESCYRNIKSFISKHQSFRKAVAKSWLIWRWTVNSTYYITNRILHHDLFLFLCNVM